MAPLDASTWIFTAKLLELSLPKATVSQGATLTPFWPKAVTATSPNTVFATSKRQSCFIRSGVTVSPALNNCSRNDRRSSDPRLLCCEGRSPGLSRHGRFQPPHPNSPHWCGQKECGKSYSQFNRDRAPGPRYQFGLCWWT